MLRVSGFDIDKVKAYSRKMADRLAQDDNLRDIHLNWAQKSKVLKAELDQNKLRFLGISGQDISRTLYTELSGATIAEYYAGDKTVGIQLRLSPDSRSDLSQVKNIVIHTPNGTVPLEQVAKLTYGAEDGKIWRRDLKPTITVEGNIIAGTAMMRPKRHIKM